MSELALVPQTPLFNFSPTPGLASQPAVQAGVGVCPCGCSFSPRKAGKPKIYCSARCRHKFNQRHFVKNNLRPKQQEKRQKYFNDFKCCICGKGWIGSPTQFILPKLCKRPDCKRKYKAIYTKKSQQSRRVPYKSSCKWCNTEISNEGGRKFCSEKCASEQRRIKAKVLLRAHKKCKICKCEIPFWKAPHSKYCSRRCRNKRNHDILALDFNKRLANRIRSRTLAALKYFNAIKSDSTLELLGCSISQLKQHLESQFHSGMSWENRGQFGWHIDHIIPCASFDLSNPDEQRKCFHYTNLRPLGWLENIQKKDRLDWSPAGQ